MLYDDTLLPALAETLLGACAHTTAGGKRPNLCIAHQWRFRKREALFLEELERRLGAGDGDAGGEWREVYRDADISVFLMQWAR